ncbi:MAG: alpha/beta hydrolase [Candidatus Omnitrophica bacterium]|nr:alpha/beta hydrolase [Candidatus Omnitrophota bacterium]
MSQEKITLKTFDRQTIALDHYRNGFKKVVVLAHGFYNNKDAYLFKAIAAELAKYYDVLVFDFRGHGKSTGLFSWTADEPKDLSVVLAYAKEQGYDQVGIVGFSLGAAVAIIEASHNRIINSVIAVSAPFDFWQINFHFWEPEMLSDLKLNLGIKGKGKGVRPGNILKKKIKPIDVVSKIAPVPIYFIHGEKDWIIKPKHSEKLFEKALDPKKLLIIQQAGHAEKIFDSNPNQFIQECVQWFEQTLCAKTKTDEAVN